MCIIEVYLFFAWAFEVCGQIKSKNYFLKLHAMQLYLGCKHPSWDSINSSTGVMAGSSTDSLWCLFLVLAVLILSADLWQSLCFSGILVSAISKVFSVVVTKKRKLECTCEDQLALNYHPVKLHWHACWKFRVSARLIEPEYTLGAAQLLLGKGLEEGSCSALLASALNCNCGHRCSDSPGV